MKRVGLLAMAGAFLLCGTQGLRAETPALLWTFQGIEDINAMAALPDVDGDGVPDVLIETYDAGAAGDHLYLVSGGASGTPGVIWSARPSSGASDGGGDGDYCLAVSPDLNGDGFPDVLLGTAWGNRSVHAFNGLTGGVLWTFDTYNEPQSGWVYAVAPHPDRTGDGVPEVVFGCGSYNDTGYMLNGATGQVVWRFYGTTDAIYLTLSLPDVNGDGVADVLFCAGDNDYNVYCVSGAGGPVATQIWSRNMGGSNWAATLMDDIDGDGTPDLVIGSWRSSNQVQAVSGRTGAIIWPFHNGASEYVMRLVTISDVDGDGYRDIAIGSWANAVRVVSGRTGTLIWQSYAGTLNGGDFWAIERLDDVTGDGKDEVIGGSFDYNVYLFNGATGDTIWMHYTGNRLFSVRGAPDLSGNLVPDVLAGTQYLSGGGRAYALEGRAAPVAVPELPRVAGGAVASGGGPGEPAARVELAWTCDQPLPFRVYRVQPRLQRAAGRLLLAEAFARGELTSREVVDAIVGEQDDRLVLLTPQPIEPGGRDGALWRYGLVDDLAAAGAGTGDPLACRYRLAGELPDGSEVVLAELTPAPGGGAAPARPLIAGAAVRPNPFNPAAIIQFELDRPAAVAAAVHDARGRLVASLPPQPFAAGRGELRWDGRDAQGQAVSSGPYFVTLLAGGERKTIAATLVR